MESLRISWGVLGFVCLFVFKKKKKVFHQISFVNLQRLPRLTCIIFSLSNWLWRNFEIFMQDMTPSKK